MFSHVAFKEVVLSTRINGINAVTVGYENVFGPA